MSGTQNLLDSFLQCASLLNRRLHSVGRVEGTQRDPRRGRGRVLALLVCDSLMK